MKTTSTKPFIAMDKSHLQELTKEVKETIATNVDLNRMPAQKRVFSAADLWNIQNMRRQRQVRRMMHF